MWFNKLVSLKYKWVDIIYIKLLIAIITNNNWYNKNLHKKRMNIYIYIYINLSGCTLGVARVGGLGSL